MGNLKWKGLSREAKGVLNLLVSDCREVIDDHALGTPAEKLGLLDELLQEWSKAHKLQLKKVEVITIGEFRKRFGEGFGRLSDDMKLRIIKVGKKFLIVSA